MGIAQQAMGRNDDLPFEVDTLHFSVMKSHPSKKDANWTHDMARLDRARYHFGKHGCEQEKIFMAEQFNSDVVTLTEDLLKAPSRVDSSKTAAQNQYAM
jgi:hypothetical protein